MTCEVLVPDTESDVVTSVEGDEVVMTVDEVEEVEVEVGVLEVVEDVVEEVVVVDGVKVEVGVEATGVGKRLDVAAEVSKAYWHQSAEGRKRRERERRNAKVQIRPAVKVIRL